MLVCRRSDGSSLIARGGQVRSPQSLSESGRRLVAGWAADCAERVLELFETERPTDDRPRAAIARTRAFARGELNTAVEIRRRFVDGGAAREARSPAAAAAARAAGQAAAVCHMGAHALGAAAYAVKAASLAAPDRRAVAAEEIHWQLTHMTAEVRAALQTLPAIGECRSGPLGPGLLAAGQLGEIIRALQTGLAEVPQSRVRPDTLPIE
ncbi:putative immunity protein [Brevundimonas sp.]|uniref:putative immunity protein n=1 Tax=Brevundimonas sp. TaxID=1871086 RepID=UPI0039C87F0F